VTPERRHEAAERADESAAQLSFSPLSTDDGFEIIDPIERQRYRILTDSPVELATEPPSSVGMPVDAAVSFTARSLSLPTVVPLYVRDASGRMVGEVEHFSHETFPDGRYTLELAAPIKIYARVEAALTVTSDVTGMDVAFDGPTRVVLGGRSHHKHPAATVTTTRDPVDVMAAISTFGSALKTTSPERSYPTLRGHPPAVELGDELCIPTGLEPPATGMRIELPPRLEYVFVAAPLAFYLGATVVPGDDPKLVTDEGFEHELDSPRGFEGEVERVLKQVFFCDCLVRTEGVTSVDLHERHALEATLDWEFDRLYAQSLATQLATYLSVPFETLEGHLPEWQLTTHVAPTPESVETLPFLVNDLAVVRTPVTEPVDQLADTPAAVTDFLRDGEFVRSTAAGVQSEHSFVTPETGDTLEHAFVGEGTPIGASKATPQAFRNRLERVPTVGDIDITVVCNDEQMEAERGVVDRVYGSREALPFDVTVRRNLSTAELAEALREDVDFLHYIGHIDADGFECADGKFDVGTLENVGVDAFFLNACQSYDQGLKLIEGGAIGGIVTLEEVINSGAVRIGGHIARLLNGGFPLRAALEIAKGESVIGMQYLVVGDGGLAIAQAESRIPLLLTVVRVGDEFETEIRTFHSASIGMGSMIVPFLRNNSRYYLTSGRLEPFRLSASELDEYLQLEELPVRIDGSLRWSSELSLDED